jgi:predicted DNA-binding transcriptional regulator YafY
MHRLERLINLVAALLETDRPLTAEELRQRLPGYAEDHGAFRRAFERDKDALREMGVPLVLAPLDPSEPRVEGYRVPKEAYYLPDPGLTGDELAALHLAASAVRLEGAPGVEALWKLGGTVGNVDPPPALAALPGAVHLPTLFGAISSRRRVTFSYRGRPRTVDPYHLSFRNGHWYLAGRDHDHDEERSYRVDRIDSEVLAGAEEHAFEPVASRRPPRPWEMGDDDAVTARLLVDAEQAAWAVRHVGAEALEEQRPDGSVVLAVRVTHREAFRSMVLGFLHHAEVLSPPELRAEMVRWLEALCPG